MRKSVTWGLPPEAKEKNEGHVFVYSCKFLYISESTYALKVTNLEKKILTLEKELARKDKELKGLKCIISNGICRNVKHFQLDSSTIRLFRHLLFRNLKTIPELYLLRLVVSTTKVIQALSLILSRFGLQLRAT